MSADSTAISGFTIVRNAEKLGYPFLESVRSVLPLCEEFVINCGDSEDGTFALCEKLQKEFPAKVKIIKTHWQRENQSGGFQLKFQSDQALKLCTRPWCLYIQADEVMHEADFEMLKIAQRQANQDEKIDGILFDYLHFYGNYDYTIQGRNWYRKEVRLFKNHRGIQAYRDAQGFRNAQEDKVVVIASRARVFHYGYVRSPQSLKIKSTQMDQWWGKSEPEQEKKPEPPICHHVGLKKFPGSHPRVMEARLKGAADLIDPTTQKRPLNWNEVKNAITLCWETLVPYRIGEFRNYRFLLLILSLSSVLYADKIQQAIHQSTGSQKSEKTGRSIDPNIFPIPTNDPEIEAFLKKEGQKIKKSIQQVSDKKYSEPSCKPSEAKTKLVLEPEHHHCPQCAQRTNEVLYEIKPQKKQKKRTKEPSPLNPPMYAHEGFYLESIKDGKNQISAEPETGLYGIESPFQHSFSGLLIALQELRKYEKQPKRQLDAVSTIIDVLLFDKNMAKLFLDQFPSGLEKSRLMLGLIHFAKSENINEGKQGFLFDHVLEGKENKLLERNLTRFFKEKLLPKLSSQVAPDVGNLQAFLNSPENRDLDWPLQLQFNFHWRNQTIVQNILELYCRASKEGRDLHITLGYLHIPEVWKMLQEKMASAENLVLDPGFSKHDWKVHGKGLEEGLKDCASEKAKKMLSEPELNEKNYSLFALCFIQRGNSK